MNKKEKGDKDMELVVLTIGLLLVGAFVYFKFFKKDEKKSDSTLTQPKPKKEISPEEKAELDRFIEHYEKFAKYKVATNLGIFLGVPIEYRKIFKQKYPEMPFPELDNSIVHLDDEHIGKYILEIARKKFGIKSMEELLEHDKDKKYKIFALENLIKEKVFKEILEEIEPYVPEEKREKYEKYKKGEKKFPFNF